MGAFLSSPSARAYLVGAFSRTRFWSGVALWLFGFASNIFHDEILLNIRRKAKTKGKGENGGKEHYAIPQGYLYNLISYPNYFSEWIEWTGFALAASPAPSFASIPAFLETITPPWIFLLSEVLVMLPRAWRGHQWYHAQFPDYPKQRKAVIPFVM
jgi:3-oxo-5-alpha-steroid 4-dehydrogenase 1